MRLLFMLLMMFLVTACSPKTPNFLTETCDFKLTILRYSERPFELRVDDILIAEGVTAKPHKSTEITEYLEFQAELPAQIEVRIADGRKRIKRRLNVSDCRKVGLIVSTHPKTITQHSLDDYIFY